MARNEAEQGVALANDTIINIPPPTENRFDQSTAAGDLDAANELSSDEIQPENSLQSAGLQKELSKLWEETEDDNQDTLMENDAKSNDGKLHRTNPMCLIVQQLVLICCVQIWSIPMNLYIHPNPQSICCLLLVVLEIPISVSMRPQMKQQPWYRVRTFSLYQNRCSVFYCPYT